METDPARPELARPELVEGVEGANWDRTIAVGADHGGYALKERIKPMLEELGWHPLDLGTHSKDSVDYPDFAYPVAHAVTRGQARFGIMIDGSGVASSMCANRVPGIRAAACANRAQAVSARSHNDAQVLTLGTSVADESTNLDVVRAFLETPFEGGRHIRRVEKIAAGSMIGGRR